MTASVAAAVTRYAGRFWASAGDRHAVASPLGAWLLLALLAPAASGPVRDELEDVLGLDVDTAAAAAAALLDEPHDLVDVASAYWARPELLSAAAVQDWAAALPSKVATGPLPTQQSADEWVAERTGGQISRFPMALTDDVLQVLSSVLATDVTWEVPFVEVPGEQLGDGAWASALSRALRTPVDDVRHRQLLAQTEHGTVAVHAARAAGLLVTSVLAAEDVPASAVLAVAHEIGAASAVGREVPRRSLFDVPLETPRWSITEEPVSTPATDGREERFSTVLPAWSASSRHDLTAPAGLGFPAAAEVLFSLQGDRSPVKATQACVAVYSRTGFRAAAVSMIGTRASMPQYRPGLRRTAHVRFRHPYAVVATTIDRSRNADGAMQAGPWHGLPVFSAWVTEPDDA